MFLHLWCWNIFGLAGKVKVMCAWVLVNTTIEFSVGVSLFRLQQNSKYFRCTTIHRRTVDNTLTFCFFFLFLVFSMGWNLLTAMRIFLWGNFVVLWMRFVLLLAGEEVVEMKLPPKCRPKVYTLITKYQQSLTHLTAKAM